MNENNRHPDTHLLYEYLDGELPPGQTRVLEQHFVQCPACAGRLAELKGLYAHIAETPDQFPSHDFVQPVLDGIAELSAARPKTWRILDLSTAVQALAALILLGLSLPHLYQTFAARGIASLTAHASAQINLWLADLAVRREIWLILARRAWEQARDLHLPPTLVAQLPALEITAILAVATLLWLAGNGYLLGFWNTSSLRRKS